MMMTMMVMKKMVKTATKLSQKLLVISFLIDYRDSDLLMMKEARLG